MHFFNLNISRTWAKFVFSQPIHILSPRGNTEKHWTLNIFEKLLQSFRTFCVNGGTQSSDFFFPQPVHSPTIFSLKHCYEKNWKNTQLNPVKYSVGMSGIWVSRRRWLESCLIIVFWMQKWQKLLLNKNIWS